MGCAYSNVALQTTEQTKIVTKTIMVHLELATSVVSMQEATISRMQTMLVSLAASWNLCFHSHSNTIHYQLSNPPYRSQGNSMKIHEVAI